MYILRKRTQKLKNITFLNFITTFQLFDLKVEPVELKTYLSQFWELEMSMMYVSMYGYSSSHKVIIWSLKNQWFWNIDFYWVLLIMKLAEYLEDLSLYHEPGGYVYPDNVHFLGKSWLQHPEINLSFSMEIWTVSFNHFLCAIVKHLR